MITSHPKEHPLQTATATVLCAIDIESHRHNFTVTYTAEAHPQDWDPAWRRPEFYLDNMVYEDQQLARRLREIAEDQGDAYQVTMTVDGVSFLDEDGLHALESLALAVASAEQEVAR